MFTERFGANELCKGHFGNLYTLAQRGRRRRPPLLHVSKRSTASGFTWLGHFLGRIEVNWKSRIWHALLVSLKKKVIWGIRRSTWDGVEIINALWFPLLDSPTTQRFSVASTHFEQNSSSSLGWQELVNVLAVILFGIVIIGWIRVTNQILLKHFPHSAVWSSC